MKALLILAGEDPCDFLDALPLFHGLREKVSATAIWVAGPHLIQPLVFGSLVDSFIHLPAKPRKASWLEQLRWAEACVARIRASAPLVSWSDTFALKSISSWAPWIQWRIGSLNRHGWADEFLTFTLNGSRISEKVYHQQKFAQTYWELASGGSPVRKRFWAEPSRDPLDPPVAGELGPFPVDRLWPRRGRLSAPVKDYWVLAPGAAEESRQWPWERYLALAREVHARTGLPGVLIGTPQDALQAQRVCSDESSGLLNCVAQGDWVDYSDLLANSRFVISGDSPFARIALYLGRYTHIVWGARDPKWAAPSGSGRLQISFYPAACWPCSLQVCPQLGEQKLRCLRDLSVQTVQSDLFAGLSRYLPEVLGSVGAAGQDQEGS
jgi:ADP-heptose:LPS heptosyltransferase